MPTITDNKGSKVMRPDELPCNQLANIKRKILYIEDNPSSLRLVVQVLEQLENICILTASEPFLGLKLATENKPDLILLDINLPGMNGYDVLKKLRSKKATKNTHIMAISANAMSGDIEKGLQAGFDTYITKPIDIKQLLQSVDATLSNL